MNKYILKKDLVARWDCHYTLPDHYSRTGVLRRKKIKNKVRYLMEDVIKHEATWSKQPQQRQTVWNQIMTWVKKLRIR